MRKIAYILLIGVLISCSNQQTREHELTNKLDQIRKLNPGWTEFYQKEIIDFNPSKFEFDRRWTENSFYPGNILADFDSNFNANHTRFLINSPDNRKYIDLDFYDRVIDIDENGNLFCKGADVDQEIDVVDRSTREIVRIGFNGPGSITEDAKWIDDSNIVLFGRVENQLTLEFINLKTKESDLFIYPDSLNSEESYTEKVRLREVEFK